MNTHQLLLCAIAAVTLTTISTVSPETPQPTPGLQASVALVQDVHGITHIRAQNNHDLFFAQGYNAARDRLWQMDYWRRSLQGELASVLGPDFIARDHAAQLFLYRGDLDAEWQHYGPNAKAWSQAFVDGINSYIDFLNDNLEQLPIEFTDLDYRPSRWHVNDLVKARRHGVWQNVASEVQRSFMHCYAGPEADLIRQTLEPAHTPMPVDDFDPCDLPEDVLDTYLLAGYPHDFDASQGGSNAWAIAGSRTKSGRPILASDPHRAYTIPSLRYGVHLESPTLNVIGAGEPHMPGIAAGHNGTVAYGFTIFSADQEDLLIYPKSSAHPNAYRFKDSWVPLHSETIHIAVRDAEPVSRTLKFTRHGPVIHETDTHYYALRSVAFEPGTAPYLGQLALLSSTSVGDYMDKLTAWGSPGEHHVVADIHGDIGWQSAAKVPMRDGYDGLLPVPGDGRHEWTGFYTLSQLPSGENPKVGWVASANNRPKAPDFPYAERPLSYEWVGDARERRIAEVLSATDQHTVETSIDLQNDYTSVYARRLVDWLATQAYTVSDAKDAQAKLVAWDRRFAPDSVGATLFQVWYYGHLAPAITELLSGQIGAAVVTLADERTVFDVVSSPDVWLEVDKPKAIVHALVEETLDGADRDVWLLSGFGLGSGTSWGELLTARFQHLAAPLLSSKTKDQFHLPEVPRGGDLTSPGMAVFNDDFSLLYGASWRVVIDVGAWDNARFMNTPGQSGDPRSDTFGELYPVWANNESLPLLYTQEAVDRHTKSVLTLNPIATD